MEKKIKIKEIKVPAKRGRSDCCCCAVGFSVSTEQICVQGWMDADAEQRSSGFLIALFIYLLRRTTTTASR